MIGHRGWLFAVYVSCALSLAVTVARAEDDPDLPAGLVGPVDKDWYLRARQAHIATLQGIRDWVSGENPRVAAIAKMQSEGSGFAIANGFWTPLGPAPIPNGQTTTSSSPVSGRCTAIAVHPTNPDILYVGAAQGGVYRSLDGGATWTAIFDAAASLAIGALALAPSDPTILYVGTGESSGSCDSFFGVGLYRIDDADTAPVLNGPFNPTPTTDVIGARTFTGRSISEILIDASDPATIFVSTGSGIGGLGCDALALSPPITALRGIYRSTDATSSSPAFQKLIVTTAGSIPPDESGNRIVSDMVYDPTDATGNTIVCWARGLAAANDGGIYRTTNALAATPTFTQTFVTTLDNIRGILTANRVAGVTTMILSSGESASGTGCTTGSGALRRSIDGGVTWSGKLTGGGGFCGSQCFYDLPVAIKPDDPTIILIGGAGNSTCSRVFARSTNAGATFSAAGVADVGLHADAHAIVFAPSDPMIVYEASDGGVWRSTDAGATWTSRNTTGFSATQFQSIAVHPVDRWFTIGGTQDNGTNFYQPGETWTRADFGDGGFALVDQNAVDNVNVTMYHTYFNAQNQVVGYGRVTNVGNAVDGGWTFLGNNANGISIADRVQFYAPLALGPGNPNTVYYGTQRLYRSVNSGSNHSSASQNPISATGVISAIGISPQDDDVRIIGTTDGLVMMTQAGTFPLTNVTSASFPLSATGTRYVSRTLIDPNDTNAAWVTFGGYGLPAGQHVWKTTNLGGGAETWVASGAGIPDVPVNAMALDATKPLEMYVGTDIGVYRSTDGGANWSPYTTGMPVVAVFDMAIHQPSRTLRIATHGRGIWERSIDPDLTAVAMLLSTEVRDGQVFLSWHTDMIEGDAVHLYRRHVPGEWERIATLAVGPGGGVTYEDAAVLAHGVYDYRLGFLQGGQEVLAGEVRVDVRNANRLALHGAHPNPTSSGLLISFNLPSTGPATFDLIDASGRRVLTRDVGSLGAGKHQLDLRRETLAPGLYWMRLTQGERMSSGKVAVLK